MKLNEFLQQGREGRRVQLTPDLYRVQPTPMTVCKDGYEVSIQCSAFSYCEPRKDIYDVSEYKSFELGYPNASDELLNEYAEDDSDPTNTIYPYVPRSVVEALIDKHGGIA